MSRIAKWKVEKIKLKVVFRLQFNATHIPLTGWDKLFVSFIPADSGKATGKTTKANVRNGTCKWADPIYETTRLLQDIKTKQFDEKLYKIVVAMGSTRSSFLGEATINLADYADASKPFTVALPLHGCDTGAILHVTVQLLSSKTGFREFEQQREFRERVLQTSSDQNSHDGSTGGEVSSSEDTVNDRDDKVNTRIRLKPDSKELPSLEEEGRLTKEYADSTVGFDGSSNTSGSLYAEKHDTSCTHEIDSLKSMISGDLGGNSISQSPRPQKEDPSARQFIAQGTNDWIQGCGSDYSVDNDLAIAYEDTNRLRGSLEVAESSILDIKMEVNSLRCHANELGAETRNFAQKLATEIASGEDLATQVSLLKSECSRLKDDLARYKNFEINHPSLCGKACETDHGHLSQNLQVRLLDGLQIMEDNIRDIQSKVCVGAQDSDKSLHSDFEALFDVLQNLKQGTVQGQNLKSVPSERSFIGEIENNSLQRSEQFLSGAGLGSDAYQPESMLQLVSQESNSVDASNGMEEKLLELLRELDESKVEQESLTKKMNQMECYYEALAQELEENQRRILGELQTLRNEHSTCIYTISTAKAELETTRQDMSDQISRLSEEKDKLDLLNEENEGRAVSAEASLKRARLNYSIAVSQLQKDLELLSFQVFSMFQTNENLVRQAFADSLLPGFQGNPEIVQCQRLDLKEFDLAKVFSSQNQYTGLKKQQLGGDMLLEDLKKSLQLQEELYQKVEEEVGEMHMVNVYLDVFSRALQETLVEASSDIRLMKEKMNGLAQQLELSTESKELLMLKLLSTMDDIHSLNEYKETCIAKCNDMALRNQNLEENLQNISKENHLLLQKIAECEALLAEYRIYESKYETCAAEKTELITSLNKETVVNEYLQNKISTLKEELKKMKFESDDMACVKESLQNNVDFVQDNLRNLLASHDRKLTGLSFSSEFSCQDLESRDLTGLVLLLEELQHNATDKILELVEENQRIVGERDMARVSLSTMESDISAIRLKLDDSDKMVQKLQCKLDAMGNKLNVNTKAEEEYTQQHQELLSDLDCFEVNLQQLTSNYGGIAQEISALESINKIIGRSERTIAELTEENKALMVSLADKTMESAKLSLEVNTLKESLQYHQDELLVERNLKEKLGNKVADLTSQLNRKHCHLLDFDRRKADSNTMMQKFQCKLDAIGNKLNVGTKAEEEYTQQYEELLSDLNCFEVELQQLTSNYGGLAQEISALETINKEFERSEWTIAEFTEENKGLMLSLADKATESANLSLEVNNLKESLQYHQDELLVERNLKEKLGNMVADLTSQLNEKHRQLLDFDRQKAELIKSKQLVSDLEVEKSRVCHLLSQSEESLKRVQKESFLLIDLQAHLSEMDEYLIAADVELTFTKSQYESQIEELAQQLQASDKQLLEIREKHFYVETLHNRCFSTEAHFADENGKLLASLDCLRIELAGSIAQNRVLLDEKDVLEAEIKEYKNKLVNEEVDLCERASSLEAEQLKSILVNCEEQIENFLLSNEELEVKVVILKAKLDEQNAHVTLLEGYRDEIVTLQNQCNELTHKLSEQILKTEEFKNLSVHLKELKDKADAEYLKDRNEREPEGPPAAVKDSLRIAFIKEHYETRLQELKQQLSVSKKHNEEMLWKLQDTADEVETSKKSEASHLKLNEELGMKILELEAELQSVVSEKREKMNAYDRVKTELECSVISLECCKEEKQNLEASLQELFEEKTKMEAELTSMKELLESSIFPLSDKELHNVRQMPDNAVIVVDHSKHLVPTTSHSERTIEITSGDSPIGEFSPKYLNGDNIEAENACSNLRDVEHSSALVNGQPFQDPHLSRDANEISSQGNILGGDSEHLALINCQFKAETLRSSIDHLNEELERMKKDNSTILQEDHDSYEQFPGLQTELMRLQKVNKELGDMFPPFHEFSGSGNALERVLALEIELAESLQAKKQSSFHFQSSFLKQHSDEEAVFKTFNDINELIKDMLELKGRYTTVETELKEMQDRYSQLSLQFAEVEGERQKLMMTLKNVRASKKS